jgi:exosortase A-associated hydrolase 1
MRRILSFDCAGVALAATLDDGEGRTGLLIVSGGNEIRIGAHRGMQMLAGEMAALGHPVFRFDRRGIGDSEGMNGGFLSSGPDIDAAIAAFRAHCPQLARIVAFGNCDAASALALNGQTGLSGLVLANPWVVERIDELPAQAAIRARYGERLRDPKAWIGLFTGAINLKKLASGLLRLSRPQPPSSLSGAVAQGIAAFPGPVTILLAARDGTAIAFAAEWEKPGFASARAKSDLSVVRLDSASHSFAGAVDKAALKATLLKALA